MRALLLVVALVATNGQAANEVFSVRLPNGSSLFDDDDVESYVGTTNTFVLSIAASQRLVSNWQDFVKDDEKTLLKGTLFDVDDKAFEVMLGTGKIISGTIAIGPMTLYSAAPRAILLYGDMPLVVDQRVHIGIGEFNGNLKAYAERGPEKAFKPVLGGSVAEHFQKLNKLR